MTSPLLLLCGRSLLWMGWTATWRQSAREDALWSSVVEARQAGFMQTWASCREEDVEVLSPIGEGGFGIVAPLVARHARQQALVEIVTAGRGLVVKAISDVRRVIIRVGLF